MKVALGVQVMSDKIIYATVKLIVKGKVDIEDITTEADYEFKHPNIISTEWVSTEYR